MPFQSIRSKDRIADTMIYLGWLICIAMLVNYVINDGIIETLREIGVAGWGACVKALTMIHYGRESIN